MLYKNDLSKAIKRVKDPERRINIYGTIIIIVTLVTAYGASQRVIINGLEEDNAKKDIQIRERDSKIDSMTITQYHFVLDRLNQAEKVNHYQDYQDSLNKELRIVKKILTSR